MQAANVDDFARAVSGAKSAARDGREFDEAVESAASSGSTANSAKFYLGNSAFADGVNYLQGFAGWRTGVSGEQK